MLSILLVIYGMTRTDHLLLVDEVSGLHDEVHQLVRVPAPLVQVLQRILTYGRSHVFKGFHLATTLAPAFNTMHLSSLFKWYGA